MRRFASQAAAAGVSWALWLGPERITNRRVIKELPGLADASVAKLKDDDGVLLQALATAGRLVAVHRDGVVISADHIIEGHGQGPFLR